MLAHPRVAGVLAVSLVAFANTVVAAAHGSADAVDLASLSPELAGLTSYSGLIPIPGQGSLFYWYFAPEEVSTRKVPLVLWLQGGPGSSSQLGNLFELGPVTLDASGKLRRRAKDQTWTRYLPTLFLDQPVGTGWSFAEGDDTYARDQQTVARATAYFLEQFAALHPEAPRSLVIAGESYGGHYLPALGSHLLDNRGSFSLEAVVIGDGYTDPATQVLTVPMQGLTLGLLDEKQFAAASAVAQKAYDFVQVENYLAAKDAREELLSLIYNVSGINMYDVRTTESYEYQDVQMKLFFGREETKDLLHLPRTLEFGTSPGVAEGLAADNMRSQKGNVDRLLNAGVRILLYQGQFDYRDGVYANEAWISTLQWPGITGYLNATRTIWRRELDGKIAGYWRTWQNLEQVVVSGAGHLAPMDQPLSTADMMARFLRLSPTSSLMGSDAQSAEILV